MRFMAMGDTDVGISKSINQDSILIKHAMVDGEEVLMAIVCDGMGGLSKGELASATVVKLFSRWFDEEMPYEVGRSDLTAVGSKWALLLKNVNGRMLEYSKKHGGSLGTTFSGILLINDQYVIVHVGDSRVYQIGSYVNQLTTDQTFVAREVDNGTMTLEQAKTDKRRNMLLQCVGASTVVNPQIICGKAQKGVYMLCSDGFRHEITENEMYERFNSVLLKDKKTMHEHARYLIECAKARQESDNISVILIKVE